MAMAFAVSGTAGRSAAVLGGACFFCQVKKINRDVWLVGALETPFGVVDLGLVDQEVSMVPHA